MGAASQVASGTPASAQQLPTNFIKADPAAKFALVQDLAAWGASEPLKVTRDKVTVAEAFAQEVKAATKCQKLEGLMGRYQRRWERLK